MLETYILEKYMILKIIKKYPDFTEWNLMKKLRMLKYNIARSSLQSLIKNMVKEGYIELKERKTYKKRNSYFIQITSKGISKLNELEIKMRFAINYSV